MTRLYFAGVRSSALGHEPLRRRRDHTILRRYEVPARLGMPRSPADGALERLDTPGDLGVRHEGSQLGGNVGSEGSGELRPVQQEIPVLGRQDRRYRSPWRRILYQGAD